MCPGLNKITYNCSCSTKLSQALTTTTDSGQVNLEQQNMCTFISLWWRWNPFLSKVSFRQLIYSLNASMHLRPRAENAINFCRLRQGALVSSPCASFPFLRLSFKFLWGGLRESIGGMHLWAGLRMAFGEYGQSIFIFFQLKLIFARWMGFTIWMSSPLVALDRSCTSFLHEMHRCVR